MRLKSSIPNQTATCGLLGWRHTCSEGFNNHHLINKSRLRGNSKAKKFVEHTHPEVFLVRVCGFANRSRLADQPEARRKLLLHQIEVFGLDYIEGIWDLFKLAWEENGTEFPHDLTLKALI